MPLGRPAARFDRAVGLFHQRFELEDLAGMIALLVFTEQEQIRFILRPVPVEVEGVLGYHLPPQRFGLRLPRTPIDQDASTQLIVRCGKERFAVDADLIPSRRKMAHAQLGELEEPAGVARRVVRRRHGRKRGIANDERDALPGRLELLDEQSRGIVRAVVHVDIELPLRGGTGEFAGQSVRQPPLTEWCQLDSVIGEPSALTRKEIDVGDPSFRRHAA